MVYSFKRRGQGKIEKLDQVIEHVSLRKKSWKVRVER